MKNLLRLEELALALFSVYLFSQLPFVGRFAPPRVPGASGPEGLRVFVKTR